MTFWKRTCKKRVLENQRLADVKAKYEASKKKADMYERRVRVIDELKSAQSGPCGPAEPGSRYHQQHRRGLA